MNRFVVRCIAGAFALSLLITQTFADLIVPNGGGGGSGGGASTGSYFYNVASSVLTRASNSSAYAANETVCLLTSTAVCAPLTITIANANGGKGLINRVSLLKSGSSTTNASFTIWFFSAAPGTTSPSQFDATAYAGPRASDMPNYMGMLHFT